MQEINKSIKVAITGGCGYIGSTLIEYLNNKGITNIDIYDVGDWTKKWKNLIGLKYNKIEDNWKIFNEYHDVIISLGANSATTAEPSLETYNGNTSWSNTLITHLKESKTRLIHASSASVYGSEEKDFNPRVQGLKPINFYAWTKLKTDEYIEDLNFPSNIYSLRFFNVYGGIREQYKGPMSSVIYRWLTQDITSLNKIQLFKSLRADFKDGEQSRDFIYVEDICSIIYHCMFTENPGGIFNAGSGKAENWLTIAKEVLKVRGLDQNWIQFIDMPEKLMKQYQYFTQSDNTTLIQNLGYNKKFTSIQEGIKLTWEQIQKNG